MGSSLNSGSFSDPFCAVLLYGSQQGALVSPSVENYPHVLKALFGSSFIRAVKTGTVISEAACARCG